MSEFYKFASESPWLTFFLVALLLQAIVQAFNIPFRIWNRTLRSRNIVSRGWPPEHCDADGDFRPASATEESAS